MAHDFARKPLAPRFRFFYLKNPTDQSVSSGRSRKTNGTRMALAFLDLWQHGADVASRPAPGEGTHLPGWWELHGHDSLILLAVVVTFASIAGLVVMRWRLFDLVIVALAGAVRAWRQVRRAAAFIRGRVLERL